MSGRLLKSTAVVSSMTLISRLLGFLRDVVLAMVFGAGPSFDAFIIAFRIPNFMRRLFAEGAFAQAFVPILSEYKEKHDAQAMSIFIRDMAGCLGSVLLLVVGLIEILTPFVVWVFAPGFANDPVRFGYSRSMLNITAPYLFFIAMTAFSGSILNTYGRFAVPALTPVLLNLAMILSALFGMVYSNLSIYVLAWGVLIGGVVQLMAQLPFLCRVNMMVFPRFNWRNKGVKRVLKLMIPALFGVSAAQMSVLMDSFFASFLPVGSVSWLYYADRFTYLPVGLVGVALATVVLPTLSQKHHRALQSPTEYSATLDWSIKMAFLFGLPAAVGLGVLALPVLVTLIYHGAFTAQDLMMTKGSLCAFAVGVPGFILIKVLASGFYSRQEVKTPVKVAIFAVFVNLIFNLLLIRRFAHVGLALATSIAALTNAGMLMFFLLQRKIYRPLSGWGLFILRLFVANTVMGMLLIYFTGHPSDWMAWSAWVRIWHLALLVSLGLATYIASLWLTGFRIATLKSSLFADP